MKRFLTCLTMVFIAFSTACSTAVAHEEELFFPVEIHDGSDLSVIECVALAYKNSPKIRRQKYNLDIASSNLGIARSRYFPTFNAGVGFYHENNSNKRDYDRYYRELPRAGVTLNQLVWDFGKTTAYVKMEEFYKIAAEYEFMDSLCSTLFDVKEKYYRVLREQALLQISQSNVEINEKFVKISRKGADSLTAKVNLTRANVEHIEAQNKFENSKIDLANAMYLDKMPKYSVKRTETFAFNNDYDYKNKKNNLSDFVPQKFDFTKDKAVEIAYDSSPDLRALEASKKAMEQSLLFIKRMYYPNLTADVGYGFNKTNLQSSNNSLQVGVNLNSSVNLMELKHSIKGADAQVSLATNEIELFKKDLYYEVNRALNNVEAAEKQVKVAQSNIVTAIQNLNDIEKYYMSGNLDYTSLQNGRTDYINSLTDYVISLYDYNIALIQVEHAMHHHLVDIHHRSEHAMTHHSEDLIEHINHALGCDEKETGKKMKFKKVKESL